MTQDEQPKRSASIEAFRQLVMAQAEQARAERGGKKAVLVVYTDARGRFLRSEIELR